METWGKDVLTLLSEVVEAGLGWVCSFGGEGEDLFFSLQKFDDAARM